MQCGSGWGWGQQGADEEQVWQLAFHVSVSDASVWFYFKLSAVILNFVNLLKSTGSENIKQQNSSQLLSSSMKSGILSFKKQKLKFSFQQF